MLGNASGGALRPGSTSVATHNPKVNVGNRPHVSPGPHKTASNKDVLSQKPGGYSGWSNQSVTHVSTTKSSHLTGSKLSATHAGTSTTHTSSNVPPVKKNKIVDGHSGKVATGSKHLVTSHSPQHTDLQNEATILSHKYPPVSSKNIDQHLASVKAYTWGLNIKKSTEKATADAKIVNRLNVSTSSKGLSKTTTPTKSGSKVTSTKPTVNPHPTTTLAKTGTATTAPNKGSLGAKFYKADILGIDTGDGDGGGVIGIAQTTFQGASNASQNAIGTITNAGQNAIGTITNARHTFSSSLSPPIPFVGPTGTQSLMPIRSGGGWLPSTSLPPPISLPPKINLPNLIPPSSGSLLPQKNNIYNPIPFLPGSGNNIPNWGAMGSSLGGLSGTLGQSQKLISPGPAVLLPWMSAAGNIFGTLNSNLGNSAASFGVVPWPSGHLPESWGWDPSPLPTPTPIFDIPPPFSPPYLLPEPYPATPLPPEGPSSIPTPTPGPDASPTPTSDSTGDSNSPDSTGGSNTPHSTGGSDTAEPPTPVVGGYLTYDPTTSPTPSTILPDSTAQRTGSGESAAVDTTPAQPGIGASTNPTRATQTGARRVPNIFVSRNPGSYQGTVIGDGGGVNLVQQCAGAPPLPLWKGGTPVKGNDIPPGTAIATFDGNGNYQDAAAGGHAAIYDSQDQRGIWVWDQRAGQPVQRRYIRFKNGIGRPGNDGDAYSVISQ